MIKSIVSATLSGALEQLKKQVILGEGAKERTVIFCEDRLSLAAERMTCAAVGGTFLTSVYTFSRFLSANAGKPQNVLSAQGSAMAVRRIIEENKESLTLFKQLASPNAAQAVYDTIALFISSHISAEELKEAKEEGLLGGKLADLALIYSKYAEYLKTSGMEDRNGYLKKLAPIIEKSEEIIGANVIFLGYQAFTRTTEDCLISAFKSAKNVTGLFIGGEEDLYVNEAPLTFLRAAQSFGGCKREYYSSPLCDEAEILRKNLFNPEGFFTPAKKTDKVFLFEGRDREEEFEFIAASIKKRVSEGERYAKISVMLPDLKESERGLRRVFSQYEIPYYADRRFALSEHPVCAFITDYILCALYGCRPQDVDAVVASPYFPAERADKDAFRTYSLRYAAYRGAVKRETKRDAISNAEYTFESVEGVRQTFLKGLKLLPVKGDASEAFEGAIELLKEFDVYGKAKELYDRFSDELPASAAFGLRAPEEAESVLKEAAALSKGLSVRDGLKILKSGFAAAEISIIPPKTDAVFVGDIASTANTGSNVVFAACLSGEVPQVSLDDSLLTDRELDALEKARLGVSPKIRQVNGRKRETVALNICAFRKALYLTYSLKSGSEQGVSQIISYCSALFCSASGAQLAPSDYKRIERTGRAVPYYASEKLPAIKQLIRLKNDPRTFSDLYRAVEECGFKKEADAALKNPVHPDISCGEQLYLTYNSISPTALESYFSCPYLGFMRQGLKLKEREDGAVRPLDTGNFIHTLLEELARSIDECRNKGEFCALAESLAEQKLTVPPYSSLREIKSGEYTAEELKKEAVKIAEGMYLQVKNSRFKVSKAEGKCEIPLYDGVKIYGKTDRIDVCGDMVRIIDYKTGTVDDSPAKYYTGAKLQLPLYLLAASKGKRAVGAYYFPATVEYRAKTDGVFRLKGYMDGSYEVITASDINIEPKKKSEYIDAYLNKTTDTVMERETFEEFLNYSKKLAERGAREMLSGNITPSPAEGVCKYCPMGGSCGFDPAKRGERKTPPVKCADIAAISSGKERSDG